MKKLSLMFFIVLISAILIADNQWDDEGVPIRKGVNIEWTRAAQSTTDGAVVYVWSDTRIGDRDLWAQKVDQNGNVLWGVSSENPHYPNMIEGLLVNGEINRQEDPVIIGNDDGSVIIAWVDFRNEDAGDVYAQKLDTNGDFVWATEGVPICLAGDIQISLNIVNDANGGAYIIWQDSRNPGGADIYGTHVLTDGTIAAGWDANGNPIASEAGNQNQHTFWEDGQGGAIVVWHDTRNPDDENLYMQRMNSNGTLLWDTNGTLLTPASGSQENAKISLLNDGNFFITWRDKRNDSNGDIYARKVDLDGNLLWDNEIVIYEDINIQQNPRVTASSDDAAFVVWEDGRYDTFFKELFVQKIDTNGNLLWDNDGIVVCDELNDQLNPRLVADDNGGTIIIWDDGRIGGHPNENIYVQHFNSDGNIQFVEDGLLICGSYGEQFSPLIKKGLNGKYFINWGDWRTGSVGIFFQILNEDGTTIVEDDGKIIYYGLNGDALNFRLIENDDNPIIAWEDTRFSSIANQIYMQTLNTNNGSVDLVTDGIPITTMSNHNQDDMDVIYSTDANVLGFVWKENKIGNNQIFGQGVDIDGNFIWSDSVGINLCSETDNQEFPAISVKDVNDNPNFFVGWSIYRDFITGFAVYGQRVTADGTLLWGDEGILIANANGDDVLNDVVENYYIWHGGVWPNKDLFVKKVNDDGTTADGWSEDGLILCDATGIQENAKGMMIPEGLLIVWEDKRSGTVDLYGQIVAADGSFLWGDNGVPLNNAPNDQKSAEFLYDEDLYMVWEDFRTGIDEDIYAQRIDGETGNSIWDENNSEVAIKDSAQTFPSLVKTDDNLFIFWQDNYSQAGSILFGQLLDLNGNPLWPADGVIVCDAIKNQNEPQSILTPDDKALVIWQDTRSSGKTDIYNIYAQKVDSAQSGSNDNEIPDVHNVLQQNYPNPFNPETTIRFSVPQGYTLDNMNVNIYNLKGQKVKSLHPEINSVVWNGLDKNNLPVSNGIYFYRLESKDFKSNPKKMILLK